MWSDKKHKKEIPFMPKIIGVLTSNTGAVIRDIINVSTRRNPNVNIRLLPVPVQGEGAAAKIAKAIKLMNEQKLADVIRHTQRVGNLFTSKSVVPKALRQPIQLLNPFWRWPDAAELAVPNVSDIILKLENYNIRYKNALKKKIEVMKLRYEKCMMNRVFRNPLQGIQEKYVYIDRYNKSMENSISKKIQINKTNMIELITKLDNLSPLKTLTRGYSIIEKNNKIVKSVKDVTVGDEIEIRLIDGKSKAKVCE